MSKGIATIIVCGIAAVASAQWTYPNPGNGGTAYHTGANGASAGRSQTVGDTTYHYNANGTSAGRSTTSGNTTYHYDAQGRPTGTTRTSGGSAQGGANGWRR